MAVLEIYSCFHPVLKKKTEKVEELTDEVKKLIQDMFETMVVADGVGLAANQVGISKSIVVIDCSQVEGSNYPPMVLINPEIVNRSEEEIEINEGCLSIPTVYEKVSRSKEIVVEYYDENMNFKRLKDDGFLARVIQHEVDHLNGRIFIEHLSGLRRAMLKSKLKSIQKGRVDTDYKMVFK